MVVRTFAGQQYVVSSATGCSVTDGQGLFILEVEAGKQAFFVAVSGSVTVSDDEAVVIPFEGAPVAVAGGGGSSASAGDQRTKVVDLGTLVAGEVYDMSQYVEEIPEPAEEHSAPLPTPLPTGGYAHATRYVSTLEIWFIMPEGDELPQINWPSGMIWLGFDPGTDLNASTAYRFAVRRESAGDYVGSLAYSYPVS